MSHNISCTIQKQNKEPKKKESSDLKRLESKVSLNVEDIYLLCMGCGTTSLAKPEEGFALARELCAIMHCSCKRI